jgi:hypothetical protein
MTFIRGTWPVCRILLEGTEIMGKPSIPKMPPVPAPAPTPQTGTGASDAVARAAQQRSGIQKTLLPGGMLEQLSSGRKKLLGG